MNYDYQLKYFVKKEVSDSWKLDDLPLPFCDLTFILQGSARYTFEGASYLLTPGEAVFVPVGSVRHAQTKGMQCAAFNFCTDAPPFPCPTKIRWDNDSLLYTYFEDFNQAWNTKSPLDKMRCDGLFLLIIGRLMELCQTRQGNPYVTRIKKYLHSHYTEKITVQQIAEYVNLNPVYCGALFAKETGSTILNYTNQLRVMKAKELLQCTNESISEIALAAGIDDLYYFSRIFKQIAGISPRQYRMRQYKR